MAGRPPKHPSGRTVQHTVWLAPATLELLRQLSDRLECSQADVIQAGLEKVLKSVR